MVDRSLSTSSPPRGQDGLDRRRPRGRRFEPADRPRVIVAAVVLTAVALVLVAGVTWRLSGGRWAIIETASMGRAVPVGTVIFSQTEPVSRIKVGDVVSYHPSNAPKELYTHRVVSRHQDGSLQVQGDLNGAPDPLPVRQVDLVGVVVHQWYGMGWLIRALPFLIVGILVIMVATAAFVRSRWRSAARIMTISLLFSISALILRPFVRPVLMGVSTSDDRGPMANVVSTGLMPTRVTGAPHHFIDLVNGQAGQVPVTAVTPGEAFRVSGSPHLDLLWLVVVVVACAIPLLWCLIFGLSPEDEGAVA